MSELPLDQQGHDGKIDKLLSALIAAEFDLYAFMNLTVQEMLTLTPATGVVVELAEGDEMVYRAATGTMEAYLGLRLPIQGSITGLCVELKEVLRCDDTEVDPRVNLPACKKVGARSLVVAPLFNLNKAVGVLKIISDKPSAFTTQDIETLKQVAGCLGSALARQLREDLRNFF